MILCLNKVAIELDASNSSLDRVLSLRCVGLWITCLNKFVIWEVCQMIRISFQIWKRLDSN
jgi:hypothetical protein